MSYIKDVAGRIVWSAARDLINLESTISTADFILSFEQASGFEIIKRQEEITDTIKWTYQIDFQSEQNYLMFILRWS
jgi:hypothetical protein